MDRRFHLVLGWASGVVSIVAMLCPWVGLGSDPDAFLVIEHTSGVFADGPVDLVSLTIVPVIVVGVAGRWIGQRVGTWYTDAVSIPSRDAPMG